MKNTMIILAGTCFVGSWLAASCTQAQQTKALQDSRTALDKACAVRAAEKALAPDGGPR